MIADRPPGGRIASLFGRTRALRRAPLDVVDDVEVARAHLGEGRLSEAQEACDRALAEGSRVARATFVSGLVAAAHGDLGRAAELVRSAIERGEATAEAHMDLGKILFGLGRFEDAGTVLMKADDLDPGNASIAGALGVARLRGGDVAGAIAAFERGVEAHPTNAELLNNLGGVYKDTGRLDDAIARFRDALAVDPKNIRIWLNLATSQMAARQWAAATENFRNILLLDDRLADAWSGLGSALAQMGDYAEAVQACREAVALRPDWARGHLALGSALALAGNLDAAEDLAEQALRLDPDDADLWLHRAGLHQAHGRFADADRCHRRAIEIGGLSPKPRYDYGLFLLSQGDFRRGFELVESRFDALPGWYTRTVRTVGTSREPWRWRGGRLDGRSILIIGEQGFGDHLMVFRFLAELKHLGAIRVAVACTRPLIRIASLVEGVDEVVEVDTDDKVAALLANRQYDLYCPLMSVPHALGITAAQVHGEPYLRVVNDLACRHPRNGPLRIGLVWAGNSTQDDPQRRGFTLRDLDPLTQVGGVTFVSLQKDTPDDQQIPADWSNRIVDGMGACADFLDTARVVGGLDLVIAVDTAVAHLAAGMGVSTWVLLKARGEWRWGATATTSPWYASMRIFRQQQGENWQPVVARVADALADFAERPTVTPPGFESRAG